MEDRARRRLGIPPLSLEDEALERVEARVVSELEYADIASAASTSELVIRKRVSRGLARLRARMEERA